MSKKAVRSGQILIPFGIGQIVNFPGEVSLMIGGLDLWEKSLRDQGLRISNSSLISFEELKIHEPRLKKLLNVDFFVKPFPFTTAALKNNYLKIPAVRFPGWHYCVNPRCGRMHKFSVGHADDNITCPFCSGPEKSGKHRMIPVRFVAVCEKGHIQDVPFKEWVHRGPVQNDGKVHDLTYHAIPGSGDLGSILLKCSCGMKRTLAGIMHFKNEADCSPDEHKPEEYRLLCEGHRPWLGLEGIKNSEACNNRLRVLIKGGSNVHFSKIISALYLPSYSDNVNEHAAEVVSSLGIEMLKNFYNQDESGTILKAVLKSQQPVINGEISLEKLYNEIVDLLKDNEDDDLSNSCEDKIRLEEFNEICKGYKAENSDFKAIKRTFSDYLEKGLLEKFFEYVVLVEKLKETKVFTGFARINSNNPVCKNELSNKEVKWLPAIEVYGEGIFLKFKDEIIEKWLCNFGEKFESLIERFHQRMFARKPDYAKRDINPAFIMLHTFAHLLLKRLCFSCGYGSSALRERIYFSSDEDSRMNGILIYTSSGDSEGSMGGLVKQGKEEFLGKIIKATIEDANWCSADPVCSDVGRSSGQGPDNVNGSACHNCCIVPETSCEEFNCLLDRASIIGTFDEKIGFFNKVD